MRPFSGISWRIFHISWRRSCEFGKEKRWKKNSSRCCALLLWENWLAEWAWQRSRLSGNPSFSFDKWQQQTMSSKQVDIFTQAGSFAQVALIIIPSCSNAQVISCSNTAINTTLIMHVATLKHNQHAQKCLRHNHQEEEHNETQWEYVENPTVSTPPFGPSDDSRVKVVRSTSKSWACELVDSKLTA